MTTIETDMGNINCELYEKRTPNTIMNFVGLARGLKAFKDPATGQPVKRKFYDVSDARRACVRVLPLRPIPPPE